MPQRNSIKTYVKDGIYHIYNRGVEKRNIFEDQQDYKVFLGYLKEYLTPPPDPSKIKKTFTLQGATFKGIPRQPKNYFETIELLSHSLMPNHFHFILKQKAERSMAFFLKSLATRYSMYFNKKYDRVGKLFQGHYKAVLIYDEKYLLYLSKYIHRNPIEYAKILTNAYSSYSEYLGLRNTEWIRTDLILGYFETQKVSRFTKHQSYKNFVENVDEDETVFLGDLVIEK